ncbi:hypothetical protein P3L18_28260, partial [Gordonia sp. N1V]|nr:hypothetical protein [Gordonia sp. N1V]
PGGYRSRLTDVRQTGVTTVVHVVCGDVAADFEASMATAREVKARAIDMFGDVPEPSVVCGRPIVVADGASAVDRVAAFVAVSPVLGFVVEDAVGWSRCEPRAASLETVRQQASQPHRKQDTRNPGPLPHPSDRKSAPKHVVHKQN